MAARRGQQGIREQQGNNFQTWTRVGQMLEELTKLLELDGRAEIEETHEGFDLNEVFERNDFYSELLKPNRQLVIGPKGTGKTMLAIALREDIDGHIVSRSTERGIKTLVAEAFPNEDQELTHNLRAFLASDDGALSLSSEFLKFWDWFRLYRASVLVLNHCKTLHKESLTEVQVLHDELASLGVAVTIRAELAENSTAAKRTAQNIFERLTGAAPRSNAVPQVIQNKNLDELRDQLVDVMKRLGVEVWLLFDRLDEIFTYESSESHSRALTALFQSAVNSTRIGLPIEVRIFVREDIFSNVGQLVNADTMLDKCIRLNWTKADIKKIIYRRLMRSNQFRKFHERDSIDVVFGSLFDDARDLHSKKDSESPLDWIFSSSSDGLSNFNPRNALFIVSRSISNLVLYYKNCENNNLKMTREVSPARTTFKNRIIFFGDEMNRAYRELSDVRSRWLTSEFPAIRPLIKHFPPQFKTNEGFKSADFLSWYENFFEKEIAEGMLSSQQALDILVDRSGFLKRRKAVVQQQGDSHFVISNVYRHKFSVQGKVDDEGYETQETNSLV
jgi:hypothetical protein